MSWFDEQGAPPEDMSYYGASPTFNERGPYAGQPQPPITGGGGTSQGGGFEPFNEAAFWAILESFPPTNEGQRAAEAEINRRFGPAAPKLLDHPQRLDKWQFSDGRVFDTVGGAGGPNPTHARMLEGPGHGGGGGAAGGLGGMIGSGNVAQDPSFQFRLQQGQQALERSAAAKGTLLTGGTAKALTRYAQDYASTEYQNIYNRLMGTAQLGLQGAQAATGAGTSYANQATNTAGNFANNQTNLLTQQGNVNAAGQVGSTNAWGNTIGTIANMIGGQLANRAAAPSPTSGRYSDPNILYGYGG